MAGETIIHRGRMVEIYTVEALLVMTIDEYNTARRRGQSVALNRQSNNRKLQRIGGSLDGN